MEILIRAKAFVDIRNGLKDFWFVFDTVLVAQVILEVWVMYILTWIGLEFATPGVLNLLRLCRMARTARLMRLMRKFPELIMLLRGIVIAVRSVMFTFILLTIMTYMFSIAMKVVTANTEVEALYFVTVLQGMRNLAVQAIVPDLDEPIGVMIDAGLVPSFIYFVFVFIVGLTMMNMLIGVLCEVISIISAVEREEFEMVKMKDGLIHLIMAADQDGSGCVSIKEFTNLLANPEAVKFLNSVDIDALALVDFADSIFKNGKTYDYSELIQILTSLRNSNQCTVKDMADLRTYFDHGMADVAMYIETIVTGGENSRGYNPAHEK